MYIPSTAFKHIAWSHEPTHDQNQSKSLPAPTHRLIGIKHETLTRGKKHCAESAKLQQYNI